MNKTSENIFLLFLYGYMNLPSLGTLKSAPTAGSTSGRTLNFFLPLVLRLTSDAMVTSPRMQSSPSDRLDKEPEAFCAGWIYAMACMLWEYFSKHRDQRPGFPALALLRVSDP